MNIRVTLHDETTRRSIEDAIERLLGLLDGLDADPDLEPDNDDEPGTWTEFMQSRGSCTIDDENLENGADDEPDSDGEPDADGEPSLGWPENFVQGSGICGSFTDLQND